MPEGPSLEVCDSGAAFVRASPVTLLDLWG